MRKILMLSIALLTLLGTANYTYAQEFGDESTMTKQQARAAQPPISFFFGIRAVTMNIRFPSRDEDPSKEAMFFFSAI
jgi:hypothetical protein